MIEEALDFKKKYQNKPKSIEVEGKRKY